MYKLYMHPNKLHVAHFLLQFFHTIFAWILRFQDENRQRLEANQRARYSSAVVGTWLGFRLQMLGVAMITAVAVIAVLEHHFRSVNPGKSWI